MIGGFSTGATPDDLPMKPFGHLSHSRLTSLKVDQATMPNRGNVQTASLAALPISMNFQRLVEVRCAASDLTKQPVGRRAHGGRGTQSQLTITEKEV
jgi:hypothetical protein